MITSFLLVKITGTSGAATGTAGGAAGAGAGGA